MIHFQLDCVHHCPSLEWIQANIHKMSRGICEGVYANQVLELPCIKKIKQGPNTDDLLDRAGDTWLRMLQQVPRISEAEARNIVQHYPTMQSLWQAYQECDEEAENWYFDNPLVLMLIWIETCQIFELILSSNLAGLRALKYFS